MPEIRYIQVIESIARILIAAETDKIAAPPESSVITEEDWKVLASAAGGEEALLAVLGATWEMSDENLIG